MKYLVVLMMLLSGCGDHSANAPQYAPIAKKNGTFDKRADDLHELCKDWVFYKAKTIKYNREADQERLRDAQKSFQDINSWLSAYRDNDVSETCSLYDTKENMAKYMR